MNVLIVSQCNKNALSESRRILDQFAERKGDRTWQTAITLQGLNTLRKMLKKSARRNTAIACHRIGGKNHSELLWIVGNIRKFNELGTVPTNFTQRNVLKSSDENSWHRAEDIALFSTIAALFHDFGKANTLFQKKLKAKRVQHEPYRHEWVSLRMFQAFVGDLDDQGWLEKLKRVTKEDEGKLIETLSAIKDHPDNRQHYTNPFAALPLVARVVGWLILTHHKLPCSDRNDSESLVNFKFIEGFLHKIIDPSWNSPQITQYVKDGNKKQRDELDAVWVFPLGTPLRSETWCKKAHRVASRALNRSQLYSQNWFDDIFTLHVSRMVLMLSDHYFSSIQGRVEYRDSAYKPIANTDRKTGQPKQRLDEHLIGVYRNAHSLSRMLPALRTLLPAITRHPGFKRRSADKRFQWQDKAFDLAVTLNERSHNQGFFGVNLASTGCGKTFANARIMYALADSRLGCRFSVALGLRTLTLQTGDAFREKLKLDEDDLAVLVGSAAVRALHEENYKASDTGSESSAELLEEDCYVSYEGALSDGALKHWLEQSPKLNRLVSAPVLVSTIDHLMPATEGTRGGKQIAPMLRLLSSDLVLDEPDDFGLDDIPALCRLVHWAGLLGARVLMSSATLSPGIVSGLFTAYQSGREKYQEACGELNPRKGVCCAWFDEWGCEAIDASDTEVYLHQHNQFVQKRIDKLESEVPLRKAKILTVDIKSKTKPDIINAVSEKIHHGVGRLHKLHSARHPEFPGLISIGLVRIANINPLVCIARKLLTLEPPENTIIHYCIYHSQHPLIVRSALENQLDQVLNRKDPDSLWRQSIISKAFVSDPKKDHIFVVLASPVAEVGRDHDYDWAIVEPSSMRSLVQLAGRIQRHRRIVSSHPNMYVLEKNIKGYGDAKIAFNKPGFEHYDRPLASHSLLDALEPKQYGKIDSQPCIKVRNETFPRDNLADLEQQEIKLVFNSDNPREPVAHKWLKDNATYTSELQQKTRFRSSQPSEEYYFLVEEDQSDIECFKWHENGESKPCSELMNRPLEINNGNRIWGHTNYIELMADRAERLNEDISETSKTFGAFSLLKSDSNKQWCYTPELGFYKLID